MDTVIRYVDERGEAHTALINKVWKSDDVGPAYINLIYVADESKQDQYGHQIERATSVPRKDNNNQVGRFFELV